MGGFSSGFVIDFGFRIFAFSCIVLLAFFFFFFGAAVFSHLRMSNLGEQEEDVSYRISSATTYRSNSFLLLSSPFLLSFFPPFTPFFPSLPFYHSVLGTSTHTLNHPLPPFQMSEAAQRGNLHGRVDDARRAQ